MSKLAFSLLELLIVVVLISVFASLAIKISAPRSNNFLDILSKLYPNKEAVVKDGVLYINKKAYLQNLKAYIYEDGYFKEYRDFNITLNRGLYPQMIIKSDKYYLLKPLYIKEFDSLAKAKKEMLLEDYLKERY